MSPLQAAKTVIEMHANKTVERSMFSIDHAPEIARALLEKHKELEEARDILRGLINLAEAGYPLELSEFTRASRFLASLEGK
jgi:hypothetical protein